MRNTTLGTTEASRERGVAQDDSRPAAATLAEHERTLLRDLETLFTDTGSRPWTTGAVDSGPEEMSQPFPSGVFAPVADGQGANATLPVAEVASDDALASIALARLPQAALNPDALREVREQIHGLFRTFVAESKHASAVGLVERLHRLADPGGGDATGRHAARAVLDTLAVRGAPGALGQFPGTLPGPAMRRLAELLGPRFVERLVVKLAEEPARGRRNRPFDCVALLGPVVVPHVRVLLEDARWFVPRNGLALLRAVGDVSLLPAVRPLLAHEDARVRIEAMRTLVEFDTELDVGTMCSMLNDTAPRVAVAAATLLGHRGGATATAALVAFVRQVDLRHRRRLARIAALKTLGRIGDPAVLPAIRRFFVPWSWVHPDERRAAFAALGGYPREARTPWAIHGLKAPDSETRAYCTSLVGPAADRD